MNRIRWFRNRKADAMESDMRRYLIGFLVVFLGNHAFAQEHQQEISFEFSHPGNGWVGGFSDYPQDVEFEWAFGFGYGPLPADLRLEANGTFITGNNHSDDLFMFWKRRLSGLQANQTYSAAFRVTIATDAPSGCVGVGGAPGESVYLKAGAAALEPLAVLTANGYRMNIDKGNQAVGGANAIVLGNIANGNTDCQNWQYRTKDLSSGDESVQVKADSRGGLWILVGTDSGYESTTKLYYQTLTVLLQPLAHE